MMRPCGHLDSSNANPIIIPAVADCFHFASYTALWVYLLRTLWNHCGDRLDLLTHCGMQRLCVCGFLP